MFELASPVPLKSAVVAEPLVTADRCHAAFQGRFRIRGRISLGNERPAFWNRLFGPGVHDDFAFGGDAGGLIENESGAISAVEDGKRMWVGADNRLLSPTGAIEAGALV